MNGDAMNRMGFLGASDIPVVVGLSKWKTPHQLWLEKTGQSEPSETTLRQEVGLALESLVVARAARRLGLLGVKTAVEFAPKEAPWLCVHLDALGSAGGVPVVLEAKTCAFSKRDGGWGPEGGELVPAEYWAQVQVQMAAARLSGVEVSRAVVACLFLNRISDERMPQLFEVPYDEDAAHGLLARGREFWTWVENKSWPHREAA